MIRIADLFLADYREDHEGTNGSFAYRP